MLSRHDRLFVANKIRTLHQHPELAWEEHLRNDNAELYQLVSELTTDAHAHTCLTAMQRIDPLNAHLFQIVESKTAPTSSNQRSRVLIILNGYYSQDFFLFRLERICRFLNDVHRPLPDLLSEWFIHKANKNITCSAANIAYNLATSESNASIEQGLRTHFSEQAKNLGFNHELRELFKTKLRRVSQKYFTEFVVSDPNLLDALDRLREQTESKPLLSSGQLAAPTP